MSYWVVNFLSLLEERFGLAVKRRTIEADDNTEYSVQSDYANFSVDLSPDIDGAKRERS